MFLIYILIGSLIGALFIYIIQKPKMQTFVLLDKETEKANQQLKIELGSLSARKEEILSSITTLEQQAQEAGQKLMEQSCQLAEANFEHSAETMAKQYQQYKQEAEDEYTRVIKEFAANAVIQLQKYQETINALEQEVADKQAIVSAAVEANKRTAEMKDKQNFYKLNLSDTDIYEIEKLREVLPYLRNSEPLNKVIWKVYYEKPYTDLIGRVVGPGVHTGIYKITNIDNNMCYVGQAANIADRWRQHIKRGIGAETPTRNKLYPAMAAIGVENFTFEVIEECERSLLNDREDYWQEYFHAKDFGYSIK